MSQISKSQLVPRSTIIRRAIRPAFTTNYSASFSQRPVQQQQVSKNPNVLAVTANRLKEKKELIVLNDKFATLIERVRFLEAQNKKLSLELEPLVNPVTNSGLLNEIYETEIEQINSLSDQLAKNRDDANLKSVQLNKKSSEMKEKLAGAIKNHQNNSLKINDLNKNLSENETEINLIKRRLEDLDTEIRYYKKEAQFLSGEIQHFNLELDTEACIRLQLENECAGLEEELAFVRHIHEQEIEELREKMFKDVGTDLGNFFKSELSKHIRQLRDEYEETCSRQQGEMDQWYRIKIQETKRSQRPELPQENDLASGLKISLSEQNRENSVAKAYIAEIQARITETERLIKTEIQEGQENLAEKDTELKILSVKTQALLSDYESVVKMKTSLEEEIGTYRRLLEGDQDCEGLRNVVDSMDRVKGFPKNRSSQDGLSQMVLTKSIYRMTT